MSISAGSWAHGRTIWLEVACKEESGRIFIGLSGIAHQICISVVFFCLQFVTEYDRNDCNGIGHLSEAWLYNYAAVIIRPFHVFCRWNFNLLHNFQFCNLLWYSFSVSVYHNEWSVQGNALCPNYSKNARVNGALLP